MGFLGFLLAAIGAAFAVVLAPVFAWQGEFTRANGGLLIGLNMVATGATLTYVSMIYGEVRQLRRDQEKDSNQ